MKIGMFKNNASDSITKNWNSTSNLSIITKQNTSTAFSSDFGEMRPREVRILGATDFDNWEETKTIDWIYKVPKDPEDENKYIKWKHFFGDGKTKNEIHNDYGFNVAGAYDSRGRWFNNNSMYISLSNLPYVNNPESYNKGMEINWGNSEDNNKKTTQLYVYNSESDKHTITTGLGMFDSYNYFYDYNYNKNEIPIENNLEDGEQNSKKQPRQIIYNSAVWILLKIDEDELEIEKEEFAAAAKDLFMNKTQLTNKLMNLKASVKNSKNIIKQNRINIANAKKEIEKNKSSFKNATSEYNQWINRSGFALNT
jgi:hypothetical protein